MSQSVFLLLTDSQADTWQLRLGILQSGIHPPVPTGFLVNYSPNLILSHQDPEGQENSLWAIDFALPRGFEGAYQINDIAYHIALPAPETDLKIAFVSCDGTEHPETLNGYDPDALWQNLSQIHNNTPCHLLLHGGDQIYADGLEYLHPELEKAVLTGSSDPLSSDILNLIKQHFWQKYCHMISRPAYQAIASALPSVMIWDDHDVYDGFGSHPDDLENTPAMQQIQKIAIDYFYAFQRLCPSQETARICCDFGAFGLIIPDLRSHRQLKQVMRPEDHVWFQESLSKLQHCSNLFVVSSVPLFGVEIGLIESILQFLHIHTKYDDDLRDQFCSPTHHEERLSLFNMLFQACQKTDQHIYILSGEVHMAGYATLHSSEGHSISQLISSGITHPPPPALYALVVSWLTRFSRLIASKNLPQIKLRPISGKKVAFKADRNFLILDILKTHKLRITWHFETQGPLTLKPENRRL